MSSDDGVVEVFPAPIPCRHLHAAVPAPYRHHGGAEANAVSEGADQLFHVLPGPSPDGKPLWLVSNVQKTVIMEELGKIARGKLLELRGVGRPDGGPHGNDELMNECLGKPPRAEKGAQGQIVVAGSKQITGGPPETEYPGDHSKKGRTEKIPPLYKQGVQGARPVLQAGALIAETETHPRRLPGDVQSLQELHEVGVIALVEDDEARIHRIGGAPVLDIDGVGVPSHVILGLIDDDVMVLMKQMGGYHAGDTCADDRDFHEEFRPFPGGESSPGYLPDDWITPESRTFSGSGRRSRTIPSPERKTRR